MTTTIYKHNGKKYRLADERDIGKEVYCDDDGFSHAMGDISKGTLRQINSENRFPFQCELAWKFAYVELEPEVAAVPEPPRPRWLPEGARILGDDEIIREGDKYRDDCGDIAPAQQSIGLTHAATKAKYDVGWIWFRPASEPTTTEPEQPAELPKPEPTPFEKRVDLHLSASRYLAACREHTRAIEELSAASQEMRDLVKGEARKFIVKDNYDFKHHLFTVKADGTFTVEAVDML